MGRERNELRHGWQLTSTPPDAAADPSALDAGLAWLEVPRLGPVAAVLSERGDWNLGQSLELMGRDWWYRTRFERPPGEGAVALELDGLATLADVWLNGEHVLASENMHRAYAVDVGALIGDENELSIAFRALAPRLKERRARPRWRTGLVREQNLRWIRTSLLGHVRGWCPEVPAVGPWRPVGLTVARTHVRELDLSARVAGANGVVEVAFRVEGMPPRAARLVVGGVECDLSTGVETVGGRLELPDVRRWWPHTHGEPVLYEASLVLETEYGADSIALPPLGFRTLDPVSLDAPGLVVNGVAVYARGACWTPPDLLRLGGNEGDTRAILERCRDAGMNTIRVGGTMVYEDETFFRLCDELGILVWQDFMFASLDYPYEDDGFRAEVEAEVREVLRKSRPHASLAVLCGGSETEQQPAMLGFPRTECEHPFTHTRLPALCREVRPDAVYWPSSPTGGDMPFHLSRGIAHCFSIGAYERTLEDARLHAPAFASECLAFSHVPDPAVLFELSGGDFVAPHHPAYKEGVSRDATTGWDFADVTEHYVERLYGVDLDEVRYADVERYFDMCRFGLAYVVSRAAGAWRGSGSRNQGALVWFLKDFRLGAGWGLLDGRGLPKASFCALRRAWAPEAVWLVDEGLEGVSIHVANDGPSARSYRLRVLACNEQGAAIESVETELELAAHAQRTLSLDELAGKWRDFTHAYRFGPRAARVVSAHLFADGALVSQDFLFPGKLGDIAPHAAAPRIALFPRSGSSLSLTIETEEFLQDVFVEAPGFVASDNYFHVAPGVPVEVVLAPLGSASWERGRIIARGRRLTSRLSPG